MLAVSSQMPSTTYSYLNLLPSQCTALYIQTTPATHPYSSPTIPMSRPSGPLCSRPTLTPPSTRHQPRLPPPPPLPQSHWSPGPQQKHHPSLSYYPSSSINPHQLSSHPHFILSLLDLLSFLLVPHLPLPPPPPPRFQQQQLMTKTCSTSMLAVSFPKLMDLLIDHVSTSSIAVVKTSLPWISLTPKLLGLNIAPSDLIEIEIVAASEYVKSSLLAWWWHQSMSNHPYLHGGGIIVGQIILTCMVVASEYVKSSLLAWWWHHSMSNHPYLHGGGIIVCQIILTCMVVAS